ncbi:MAG: sel1 repeat family protein [Oscillospiraceae bacterium]|nr:sel1 repeat family protein [Oscillospiraceae bacterium]
MNMMSAEELFQKYVTLAEEDNTDAFVYLQKAADLWYSKAVEAVIELYITGFTMECLLNPTVEDAAEEWKDIEKGIAYGLEAEKHGIDVSWNMMIAYEVIEDYTQAIHWAKIYDSRADKPKAVARLEKKASEMASEAMKYYKRNDYQQALVFFEKAAKLGRASSRYNCAIMYDAGKGTAANKEKSLYWYEKAAELGNVDAQFKCGVMYNKGEGVAKNIEKSLYWFEKAAEQGDITAQYNCGIIYDSKDEKESKAKALHWYEEAAEQGNVKAQFICAARYYTGKGTMENKEKALYWGEKAAEQGNVDAQYNCGTMYNKGEGAPKNYEKSLYWFEKAAEQGNTKAQGECGVMYAKGEGTAIDKIKALYWLEKVVGTPKEWEKRDTVIYEGYDTKLKEHIFGSYGTTEKGRIQDEFAIFWDDSIVKGTPVKMKTVFRSNIFIITLIAKA